MRSATSTVRMWHRWAEGQVGRLPALAAELVRRQVAVIFAGSTPSVLATKAATTTIPIVFVSAGDPVQLGVVASFNRLGGNATGVNLFTTALEPKKLELLHEFVPKAGMIGVLMNPSYERPWLDRGSHHRNRVSLGGGAPRALRRDCGRVCSSQRQRYRHDGSRRLPKQKRRHRSSRLFSRCQETRWVL